MQLSGRSVHVKKQNGRTHERCRCVWDDYMKIKVSVKNEFLDCNVYV